MPLLIEKSSVAGERGFNHKVGSWYGGKTLLTLLGLKNLSDSGVPKPYFSPRMTVAIKTENGITPYYVEVKLKGVPYPYFVHPEAGVFCLENKKAVSIKSVKANDKVVGGYYNPVKRDASLTEVEEVPGYTLGADVRLRAFMGYTDIIVIESIKERDVSSREYFCRINGHSDGFDNVCLYRDGNNYGLVVFDVL